MYSDENFQKLHRVKKHLKKKKHVYFLKIKFHEVIPVIFHRFQLIIDPKWRWKWQ